MNSLLAACTVLLVVLVSGALGWPYDDEYSAWRLARTSRRSHPQCVTSGGKCFSTIHCCHGFVCAAFDDYFGSAPQTEGMNPVIPGFCVKEKDLQPCFRSRDCDAGSKCVSLGRDGETYCVSMDSADLLEESQEVHQPSMPKAAYQTASRGNGNIGSGCRHTSECMAFDKTGSELCCQSVSRGRQGTSKMCDRVTKLSNCIN